MDIPEKLDWHKLFSLVNRFVSKYDENSKRVQSELLTDLRDNGYPVSKKKFNQWVTMGILNPRPVELGGYPEYDFVEIQKSFIASILFNKYKFRPEQIHIATQIFTSKPWLEQSALHLRDLDEGQRARLILSGRLIALISALSIKQRKSPADTIIICRELQREKRRDNVEERSPEDIRSTLIPDRALIGWSAGRQSDEVFPVMKDTKNIEQRLSGRNYYSIPNWSSSEQRFFEVILGPREHSSLNESLQEQVKRQASLGNNEDPEYILLSELLSFSLPVVPNLHDFLYNNLPHARLPQDADLITILITAVLLGDPHSWLSAAFLADDGGGMLQLRAYSHNYPLEKYPRTYRYSVDITGPMGWAFRNRSHLIYERLHEGDARLQRGVYEPGSSFAYIPANITPQQTVGLLHIIARPPEMPSDKSFPHIKIELLYALARIIGEAYYRNFIAGTEGIRLSIPVPIIPEKGETQLRTDLLLIIRDKIAPALRSTLVTRQRISSYLGLFAIRVRQTLELANYEWYFEVIRRRAFQYIRSRVVNIVEFPVGIVPVYSLENGRIVVLVSELPSDDEVRVIREGLQQEFNDIAMINPKANLDVAVWSVHIPYNYLEDNFHIGSVLPNEKGWEVLCDNAIKDLVDRTQEALEIVWHVKSADKLLINREFGDALRQLEQALILSPGNSYVLRHIAQAKSGLGRHKDAMAAAIEAIKSDQRKQTFFASNHHRLAEAYFGIGEFDKACEEMEIACNRAKDNPKYNEIYAQQLILHDDRASLLKALRLLLEVESQIDPEDREHLAWISVLRGEAHLRLMNPEQASGDFVAALRIRPRDRIINWFVEKNLHLGVKSDQQSETNS